MKNILDHIKQESNKGKKSLALLLDPDEYDSDSLKHLFSANFDHVSYIFVGGSLLKNEETGKLINEIKKITGKPIILFPGNSNHLSPEADAVLFLSLLSGRNPEYLIGQQVISAPLIKKFNIEALPTAYMLVDGGKATTVQYVSNTFPLPNDKPDIAACTALAGKYMGFQLLYLDAGSGAKYPIPSAIIKAVKKETGLPLIVGGGIREYAQMESAFDAGADIVVIGNAIQEKNLDLSELQTDQLK